MSGEIETLDECEYREEGFPPCRGKIYKHRDGGLFCESCFAEIIETVRAKRKLKNEHQAR